MYLFIHFTLFAKNLFGKALGLFSKLAPYWIEFAIAFSFFLIIVVYGIYCTSSLIAEEIGLEYYHFPLWFKWAVSATHCKSMQTFDISTNTLILSSLPRIKQWHGT